MVQISKKDKEKVLGALHSGKIDTAELALPALAITAKLKQKTSLTDIPFAVSDACRTWLEYMGLSIGKPWCTAMHTYTGLY